MCCCGKATINGELNAYSWDGKHFMMHEQNPPDIQEGDELLYDGPGRCGGVDSHSFHFRVVKQRYGGFALLVRHGGGDERLSLRYSKRGLIETLDTLTEPQRYWLMQSLYHLLYDTARGAREKAETTWRKAAAEKRIKTRKYPARGTVKVWIEPAISASAEA